MNDKPSYFSILTAAVRYDKTLCANAKLLYSEITALTQKEGYCWAANQYFADLYEVDVSTAKRWISNLEKAGHIEIHTKKEGMSWDRKIYVKNVYEGSKRSPTKAQKEALRGLENEPIIKQGSNNKENNDETEPVVVPSSLQNMEIPKELKQTLAEKYKDDPGRIENACKAVSQMKPRNLEATIQTALADGWLPKTSKEDWFEKNKAWSQENILKYDLKKIGFYTCVVLSKHVEFTTNAQCGTKCFNYEDVSFQEEVMGFIKNNHFSQMGKKE